MYLKFHNISQSETAIFCYLIVNKFPSFNYSIIINILIDYSLINILIL